MTPPVPATDFGIIDFNEGEAKLLLEKAGELLRQNEEADFYCDISGVHYALNAEVGPTPNHGERLAVIISEIVPRKNPKSTPDLWGICVLFADDEGTLFFSPYQRDDHKLSGQAKAVLRSIARALDIELP